MTLTCTETVNKLLVQLLLGQLEKELVYSGKLHVTLSARYLLVVLSVTAAAAPASCYEGMLLSGRLY